MLIQEKMLIIYIQYYKSIEQIGKDRDNIQFILHTIAELLLTFLAVVQPLQQTFLQQVILGALLSPYLFLKIDGIVQQDEIVLVCLSRTYARAKVLAFKVAQQRQAIAFITKEKFTPQEQANFSIEEHSALEAEGIKEEELLVDIVEGSNYSF